MSEDERSIDGWAIVEMLGHRQMAGRVRETQVAGAGFLRLDVPATDAAIASTHLIAPASVYALHPVDEETARLVAANHDHAPMNVWAARRALERLDETAAAAALGAGDDQDDAADVLDSWDDQ